jgi:hypothetical protein
MVHRDAENDTDDLSECQVIGWHLSQMEVIPLYGLLVDFSQSVALPCLSSSLFSE